MTMSEMAGIASEKIEGSWCAYPSFAIGHRVLQGGRGETIMVSYSIRRKHDCGPEQFEMAVTIQDRATIKFHGDDFLELINDVKEAMTVSGTSISFTFAQRGNP